MGRHVTRHAALLLSLTAACGSASPAAERGEAVGAQQGEAPATDGGTEHDAGLAAPGQEVDDEVAAVPHDGNVYVVIVKVAGFLPELGPEDRPDAITRATTSTYNTHAYAGRLQELLTERHLSAEVVDHLDCPELSCAHVPNAESTASIVVVAAKTEYLLVLQEGRALVPHLGALDPPPEAVAVMTSYGSADTAVPPYERSLVEQGLQVVPGVGIGPAGSIADDEIERRLVEFADRLADAPIALSEPSTQEP